MGNEKEFAIAAADAARCFAQVRALINEFWPSATGRPILVGGCTYLLAQLHTNKHSRMHLHTITLPVM